MFQFLLNLSVLELVASQMALMARKKKKAKKKTKRKRGGWSRAGG